MTLVQMSFAGGIMILVIILVRLAAVNRLPKKLFNGLWKIALLRLLVPFSIPSVFSVYSLIAQNREVYNVIMDNSATGLIPSADEALAAQGGMADAAQKGGELSAWLIIWCIGFIICGSFFVITYLRCQTEFKMSFPVKNEFVTEWHGKYCSKRNIEIRQSGRIVSPITYGILHPVILMPKNTDWTDERRLRLVLMHEYVHICNYDAVYKILLTLALCVHWFNPAVWVMYILSNKDIELGCDESVLRSLGEGYKAVYAKMLVSMEENKNCSMLLYNNFSKNAIEERVKAVMGIKKVTAFATALCVVIFAGVIVLFATSMKGQRSETFDVPEIVLDYAKEYASEQYDYIISHTYEDEWVYTDYTDWRIENIEYSYTYDNLCGMQLEVYNMNYEFLAASPDEVTISGGMYISEEGWVMQAPNTCYLIFEREGDSLKYITVLCENDCFPGDAVFTEDLENKLKNSDMDKT
ncbi:MAG: M56 family metallopeptidase [Lachnospiraceae bacterium]|nr:M56 family metallopeptidase [Lachnospiraceae bacterium]